MKLRSFLALMGFVSLLSAGCSKDNDDDDGPGKKEALTTSKWKLSTATASGFDVSSQIRDCYRDNLIIFDADQTGMVEESTIVCDPSTATDFFWQFKENESKLSASTNLIPGGNGDFTIVTLNSTTMVLTQETNLIPSPTPIIVTITLVHP